MRRVLTYVLVGVAALTALLVGRALLKEDFEPHGERAVTARAAAGPSVAAKLSEVVGDSREHGRARSDTCSQGQNNWKRRDQYAWDCRVAVRAVIDGAATDDDVVASLLALHERVVAGGCSPRSRHGGLVGMPTDYWQKFRTRAGYRPDDLPVEFYDCTDGIEVEVRSSTPDATEAAPPARTTSGSGATDGYRGNAVITHEDLPAAALAAARSSHAAQLYVVRVSRAYYHVDH